MDLTLYLNRDLSSLKFNFRVLLQALDKSIPPLERLKFILICSSNLDEFFEIRVAGLKQHLSYGAFSANSHDLSPATALKEISRLAHQLVEEQYQILNEIILPLLATHHIHFLAEREWSCTQKNWLKRFFHNEIIPIVSPISLDIAHPFPRLVNKSLNLIVELEGKDAFGRKSGLAIIHAPHTLQRIIALPENICGKGNYFVLLNYVIKAFAKELFPGMKVHGCYAFRLTRNSDLMLEEETDDLALTIQNLLPTRRYGAAVRLEMSADCPLPIVEFLLQKHHLGQDDVFMLNGPVNLGRFAQWIDSLNRPELLWPPLNRPTIYHEDLFSAIRQSDILIHHPYQSFITTIELIRQATNDPNVLAIKQTLYRTGLDSLIVQLLAEAARAGKEVTAIIEIRARFEEEFNIEVANQLQEAGVLVVYGVVDFKTHAKLMLIVRREAGKLKHYCHLGTGNYNAVTAKLYTDYNLLTYDQVIGQDVQKVFAQLTGKSKLIKLKKLLHAPFTLFSSLMELIEYEIQCAKAGKKARIIIKINALTEHKIIEMLYKASKAGVKIDLIVRGICCLRPGVPGVSHNIQVRSIVGRFLEHERVYYFLHGGKEKIFCSSADWMERNFFKRVEVCFPIENKKLAKRIYDDLCLYLADNAQSWLLNQDDHYEKILPGENEPRICAQETLLLRSVDI